jgi:tetratricopeptide (TPR) repeat protein
MISSRWLLTGVISLNLLAQGNLPQRLARAQGSSLVQIQELQSSLTSAPGSPDQKAYSEALIDYCIVNQTRDKNPKQAKAVLDSALKLLAPRKDAESMALHAACLGHKINFSPMMGMILAPKAVGLFERAEKLSPSSPRVLTLHGVHVLYTPVLFGGGPGKALPILLAAVKAAEAEAEPSDPWAPRWGRIESLSWLAIAQGEAGRITDAQATLARAKALDPGHGLIGYAEQRILARIQRKS